MIGFFFFCPPRQLLVPGCVEGSCFLFGCLGGGFGGFALDPLLLAPLANFFETLEVRRGLGRAKMLGLLLLKPLLHGLHLASRKHGGRVFLAKGLVDPFAALLVLVLILVGFIRAAVITGLFYRPRRSGGLGGGLLALRRSRGGRLDLLLLLFLLLLVLILIAAAGGQVNPCKVVILLASRLLLCSQSLGILVAEVDGNLVARRA